MAEQIICCRRVREWGEWIWMDPAGLQTCLHWSNQVYLCFHWSNSATPDDAPGLGQAVETYICPSCSELSPHCYTPIAFLSCESSFGAARGEQYLSYRYHPFSLAVLSIMCYCFNTYMFISLSVECVLGYVLLTKCFTVGPTPLSDKLQWII